MSEQVLTITAEAIPQSFLYCAFPVYISCWLFCFHRLFPAFPAFPVFPAFSPFSAPPPPPLLLPLAFSSVPVCSLLPFRLCPCSLCFLFRVTCSCAIFHFFAIFVCRPTTASSSSLFLGPPLPGGVHFLPPLRVPRFCPPPFLCDSLGIVINVFNGFEYLKITLSLVGCKIIFIFVGQEF